jgi:predicted Zn-dependent peptidase
MKCNTSNPDKSVICGVFFFFIIVFAASKSVQAQDVSAFEKRMTEFTLSNGLKFLVLERHEAPVVSFHTHADVGSVNEVKGITGLAHLFEHLAFKGTKTIGTTDYQAEAKAMAAEDRIFDVIKAERRKAD